MDTLTLFPLDGFEPGTPEFSQLESDETNAGVQIQAHTAEDFDTEVLESVAEPVTRNVLDQRAIASDDQDVLAIYGAKGSRDSRWLGSILPGGPYPISRLVMIFPIMDVEAYSSFVQDVDDHGRGEPAWVWNGEVIDGKHYVWACLDLGIEPQYADLPDDVDPVRYLWSRNVERRHLTTSQRALIAAELSAWSRRGRPPKQVENSAILQNSCWHLTQGEAADGQDVSARLVADAARVAAETDAGLPEIPEAVRQKVVTVSDAVKVVSEPAEVKRKALDLVKEGSVRTPVAGVKRVKQEMAGREHSGSTESHSPVNFDHSVSTYLSTIGDLVNQMPAESVDLLLAIQPSDARPQVFSILASCAEHALTPRGLLIVPVHAELLPEAIRRLTPRENDRKRDVQWGVEMDLLFRDPIGNSGEPHWVELRRVAVLILGKAEAKVSPGDDIIEVPPPGKEDNDHRQGLYDSHAMGMILRRFALPGHTVCALSFDGGRSVKMATVKLNDQSLATGEYLSYMTLIPEELFGEALTSTTADDGRNKLLLY